MEWRRWLLPGAKPIVANARRRPRATNRRALILYIIRRAPYRTEHEGNAYRPRSCFAVAHRAVQARARKDSCFIPARPMLRIEKYSLL